MASKKKKNRSKRVKSDQERFKSHADHQENEHVLAVLKVLQEDSKKIGVLINARKFEPCLPTTTEAPGGGFGHIPVIRDSGCMVPLGLGFD